MAPDDLHAAPARLVTAQLADHGADGAAVGDGDAQPPVGVLQLERQHAVPADVVDDVGHDLGDQQVDVTGLLRCLPGPQDLADHVTGHRDAARRGQQVHPGGECRHQVPS